MICCPQKNTKSFYRLYRPFSQKRLLSLAHLPEHVLRTHIAVETDRLQTKSVNPKEYLCIMVLNLIIRRIMFAKTLLPYLHGYRPSSISCPTKSIKQLYNITRQEQEYHRTSIHIPALAKRSFPTPLRLPS